MTDAIQRRLFVGLHLIILLLTSDGFQTQSISLRTSSTIQKSEPRTLSAQNTAADSPTEDEIEDIKDFGVSVERLAELQSSSEFNNDDEEISIDAFLDSNNKRVVEIESSVDLPFPAEIAYDAYSNLPRQSDWSSWLHKVEYLDNSIYKSRWTMKFLGLKYSWSAKAIENLRPSKMQWKSTSGLANFGTVTFEQKDDEKTTMTLKMTLVAPRAAAAVFKKSKRLKRFIEQKMILTSLHSFREIVIENDLKER